MDDLVQTPYGKVRLRALQALQSTFDTTELLRSIDDLDRFFTQWKKQLRDDVLRIHAMAHTVINEAPLSCAPGEEGLGEIAASAAEELYECDSVLRSVVSCLHQLATLTPD